MVEAQLERDASVDAFELDVTVDEGVVTIAGVVDSITEQESAIEAAYSVAGVVGVVDEITVVSNVDTSMEDVLESDVRAALETNDTVDAGDIRVEVRGNQAILRGTVDTGFERRRAATIAVEVFGVTSVDNDLQVEPVTTRSDRRIRRDVREALQRNAVVDAEQIVVSVDDGRVTLSGVVSSRLEEQEAIGIAELTAGATSVVDELVYEPAVEASDTQILRSVRRQLRWDTRVDATNIAVSVEDGVVVLRGTVDSAAARSAAITSTWSVTGVSDVVSELEVDADAELPSIARVVENAIRVDPDIEVEDLDVTETGGIVTLYGIVDAAWMVDEAVEVAANVVGVEEVRTNLVVDPSFERTDRDIRRDIVTSLQVNALVDEEDLEVFAEDGVVTLDGTVGSWIEREEAYEVAIRTNGVVEVRSDLVIGP
jgi:osmotically-inducible protein OsmY